MAALNLSKQPHQSGLWDFTRMFNTQLAEVYSVCCHIIFGGLLLQSNTIIFFRTKNLITMQPKNFICSCYKHRSTICEFSSKGLQQGEVPTATGCHLASPQSTHLPKDLPIKPHRRHSTLGREIYWRDWYHQISSYISSSAINSHHYSSKKSTAQPASAHNITQYFFLYVKPCNAWNWLPARRLRVSSLGQADPGELKSTIHWFHWQNLSVASTWSTW